MGKQLCFTGPASELMALFPVGATLVSQNPLKLIALLVVYFSGCRADLHVSGEVGRQVSSRKALRPQKSMFPYHHQAEGSSVWPCQVPINAQLARQPTPKLLIEHKTPSSLLCILHAVTLWESLGQTISICFTPCLQRGEEKTNR